MRSWSTAARELSAWRRRGRAGKRTESTAVVDTLNVEVVVVWLRLDVKDGGVTFSMEEPIDTEAASLLDLVEVVERHGPSHVEGNRLVGRPDRSAHCRGFKVLQGREHEIFMVGIHNQRIVIALLIDTEILWSGSPTWGLRERLSCGLTISEAS